MMRLDHKPKLNNAMRRWIGEQLRSLYAGWKERVPDRLMAVVQNCNQQEQGEQPRRENLVRGA
jgi:hypothetical protein